MVCVKTPIPNLVPWGRVELPISTQDCRPGLGSGVPSGLDSSSKSFLIFNLWLLAPQSRHGIHRRRSPRGKQAGQSSNSDKYTRYSENQPWVMSTILHPTGDQAAHAKADGQAQQ